MSGSDTLFTNDGFAPSKEPEAPEQPRRFTIPERTPDRRFVDPFS